MDSWSKAGLGAVAVAAVIGMSVAAARSDDCEELRFDRQEWEAVDDRDAYAKCIAERQPLVGLDEPELVRRLGEPDERGRAELRWWLSADDAFGMKIDMLVIRYDARRGAGRARFDSGA